MQLSVVNRRPEKSSTQLPSPTSAAGWLRNYYLTRAVVSAAWIAGAVTVARENHQIAAFLLLAYPAWDGVANYFDAQNNGGLRRNPTQTLNLVISIITIGAVAIALKFGMNAVIGVFAVWAVLAGVLQLATAVRRWKTYGAQWAMALSGTQSALAGAFMAKVAIGSLEPNITTVVGYAGFGAFYFLLSAIWLTVSNARRRNAPTSHDLAA
jgi:uncharacterized membrane protein HdeD (DUF308 family)